MRIPFLLIAGLLFAANTTAQTKDTAQFVDLDTITVSATAGKPVYRETAPKLWDITHTRVALSFDRKAKTATAREWITLHPYCYASDSVVLDAKGMKIDSVMQVAGNSVVSVRYVYAADKLTIRFARKYTSRDTLVLYFRYTAMPYAEKTGGSAAISDDRGLYFINTDGQSPTKPAHIWTQGETESNSHWLITIDKPNTRFTTRVELTIPDSLVTLSNGSMVKQVKGSKGMRTDIWQSDLSIQAYAVMFAIGKYSVVKDKWMGKEVNYYVEPEYARYASGMFAHTTDMLSFFSRRTGVTYPWAKYSQVVVRDYVSGAMENTSASLFGEFMNMTDRELEDKDNEDIVAHELFHQWFGDYVTCESWSNLTVNESFANYGEQLWRRFRFGDASADELAWKDLQIYIATSRGGDPALVRYYYDDKEQMFDGISYNKGGAILHYLNSLIGDEAFDRAMKVYLTRNALSSAEAHHWRQAVEAATGKDWSRFFDQWYFRGGHPVLKVNYNYNDTLQQLAVEIVQAQEDSTFMYDLPLETAVIFGDSYTVEPWHITNKTTRFTYPYRNGVRPVLIPDVRHVLPGEIKENKKPAQWLAQYLGSKDYVSRRLAIAAAVKQMSDSSFQVLIDQALADTLVNIRRYAFEQLGRASSDRYRKRWTPTAIAAATNDKDRHVRAAACEVLGDWKVAAARATLVKCINDSSYKVAGNALDALSNLDDDTAYIFARSLVKSKPGGDLGSTVWSIIGRRGVDEDIALLREKVPYTWGGKGMSMASVLNNYLKKVSAPSSYAGAARLYSDLVIHETARSYRSGIAGFFFQAAASARTELKQAEQAADKDKVARATERLAMLKAEAQRIVDAEKEEDLKTKFGKMLNDNFDKEK